MPIRLINSSRSIHRKGGRFIGTTLCLTLIIIFYEASEQNKEINSQINGLHSLFANLCPSFQLVKASQTPGLVDCLRFI